MSESAERKIPIVILTGFLGSGKTTILNRLVNSPELKSTAIIINEFGEVGIDHLLVETSEEQIVEINNGCICCTVRGDLADKLGSLAMWLDTGRIPSVERVIIETTGLADPAPIMHTMMAEQTLLNRYRFEHVITVVDSIAGKSSLERFPEAVKQVAVADHIILSKSDLIDTHSDRSQHAILRQRLQSINPRAIVHLSYNGERLIELLRSTEDSDGQALIRDFSNWVSAADDEHHGHHHHDHGHGHAHDDHTVHHSTGAIKTFVVRFGAVNDRAEFSDFLQELMLEFGPKLLRLKGIVHVSDEPDRPAVIHGVQHVLFPVSWLSAWPDADRTSRLVFIGDDVEKQSIVEKFDRAYALIPEGQTVDAV